MTHADRDASEPRTLGGCMWCDADSCNHGAFRVANPQTPTSDATCPPDATETPEGIGAGGEAAGDRTEAQRDDEWVRVAVEVLDLNVLRAHDRMVADEVAARFRAIAAAEEVVARTRWRVSDAALREATERAEAAEAAVARVEAHGETMLRHYSRALDEIYALRQLLAYEARVVEATLEGYKTFPKSRRAAHEGQVERMRTAARGSAVPSVAEFGSAVLRTCMKEAGVPETLTRSQWEGDA